MSNFGTYQQVAVVGILYVILCTTFGVVMVFKHRHPVTSAYEKAKFEIYNAIETFASGLNNSINFYAYFAFGNKFRNDVLAIFGIERKVDTDNTRTTARNDTK